MKEYEVALGKERLEGILNQMRSRLGVTVWSKEEYEKNPVQFAIHLAFLADTLELDNFVLKARLKSSERKGGDN